MFPQFLGQARITIGFLNLETEPFDEGALLRCETTSRPKVWQDLVLSNVNLAVATPRLSEMQHAPAGFLAG